MRTTIPTRPTVLLLLAVLGSGCPHPDRQFDEFIDNTKEQREDAMNTKMDIGGMLADVTGTHFFALAPGFSPNTPLLFIATATFTAEGEGGSLDLSLQPLGAPNSDTPRAAVGDPIELPDIVVDGGGAFMVDAGTVLVAGAANPISGSDIEAALTLTGSIQSADLFCGSSAGMIMKPVPLSLEGSTFAASRVTDTSPEALPAEPVSACPSGGGEDTGTSTGTPDDGTTTGTTSDASSSGTTGDASSSGTGTTGGTTGGSSGSGSSGSTA